MLSTRWISANRLVLVSTSNIACASGSAAIAAARSSGAWRVAGPAYAASHRPSARRGLDRGAPGVGHPALLLERRHEPDVSLGPAALGAARGDAHGVAVLVALAGLAVDPAEAEQLLDRARPDDRGAEPPFLVSTSRTPGDVAWCSSSHTRSAAGSVTSSSGSRFAMGPTLAAAADTCVAQAADRTRAPKQVEPLVASGGAAGQVAGASNLKRTSAARLSGPSFIISVPRGSLYGTTWAARGARAGAGWEAAISVGRLAIASISSRRFHLAVRSDLMVEPTLICPARQLTARSAAKCPRYPRTER